MARRRLLVANWKMHKTVAASVAWARELCRRVEADPWPADLDVVVCPTLPALAGVAQRLYAVHVGVGAQNVDLGQEGPHTGAVSAFLVREAGARWAIVGHSERRAEFGETNAAVATKFHAAAAAGLIPILCVGETRAERDEGQTEAVVAAQLDAVLDAGSPPAGEMVVAYEPVWAIGSGRVATPGDAEAVAAFIRRRVETAWPAAAPHLRVLYGGSVNADNLAAFWREPDIDGALVGGASLQLDQFLAMARLPVVRPDDGGEGGAQ
jgi:triosephosphate isomerase